MIQQIFVNLPVKDLEKSIAFFTKIGFSFNPEFTNEKATCMILGENMYVMLLIEPFFKTFIKKEIADSQKYTESILAVSVENKEKVHSLLDLALQAGGIEYREPEDHGWMYSRAFQDLDGHLWEIFFADETARK